MTTIPLAYKYVAIAMMFAEINYCVNSLSLPIELPIQQKDICAELVLDPKIIGFAGRFDTADHTFSFGGDGRLRFIVKLHQHQGLSLHDYQERLSRFKSLIDTNGACGIARKALEAIDVDVARLESMHPIATEQRSFYSKREGGRELVPLPIFDVKRGDWTRPTVDVVVSRVSGEVLSIRQEDDSFSRRPQELIKNMEKLLAIPDEEFLKYTPEQRSKLVSEIAAVQYPPITSRAISTNATNLLFREAPSVKSSKIK
jgi:hypothetical protein